MSSLLKTYKKNVAKNKMEFDPMMYKNFYGSFAIAIYRCVVPTMDKGDRESLRQRIMKVWRNMKKCKVLLPFVDDKDVIKKLSDIWGLAVPYGNIGIVVTPSNSLFVPCYKKEDGRIQMIPLREDGLLCRTLLEGKLYVIKEDGKNTHSDA